MLKADIYTPSEFLKKLLEGDSRCRFQRGDDVEITILEEGGRHPIGTPGIVIGCMYLDEPIPLGDIVENEVYWIVWDEDPVPTIGGGWKYGPAKTPS